MAARGAIGMPRRCAHFDARTSARYEDVDWAKMARSLFARSCDASAAERRAAVDRDSVIANKASCQRS